MQTKRSDSDIATEVTVLRECLTYIPEFTRFGDNNREAVERQIEMLEKKWSEDDLYNNFANSEHAPIDENNEEDLREEIPEALFSAMLEAILWREGTSEESPSSGWQDFKPSEAKDNSKKKSPKKP